MNRQKTAILQAVRKLRSHPTVDEIFAETRRSLNSISLATVYRGLEWLADHGLIMRVGTRPRRYDHQTRPHSHVVCRYCGRVEDLRDVSGAEAALVEAARRAGYSEVQPFVVLSGVCRACRYAHVRQDDLSAEEGRGHDGG